MSLIRLVADLEKMQKLIIGDASLRLGSAFSVLQQNWKSPIVEAFEKHDRLMRDTLGSLAKSLDVQIGNSISSLPKTDLLMKDVMAPALKSIADWQTRSLEWIAPQFQPLIHQMAADSRYIGSFEISDDDGIDALESDGSEASEIIIPRLQVVNNLPIRVMRAILANPDIMKGMDPYDFEKVVAELLSAQGFQNIQVTPRSGDRGRDVLATQFVAGIPVFFCFECKRYKEKIGVGIMRLLLGAVMAKSSKANKGVLVTTSSFTSEAKLLIAEETMVDGKDFSDLVKWIDDYRQAIS